MTHPHLTPEQEAELKKEREIDARDRKLSERGYRQLHKNYPGEIFILAEVRTQFGAGTWLRLQVGTNYDWSNANLKLSPKTLESDIEKIVDAQAEVFKLTLAKA